MSYTSPYLLERMENIRFCISSFSFSYFSNMFYSFGNICFKINTNISFLAIKLQRPPCIYYRSVVWNLCGRLNLEQLHYIPCASDYSGWKLKSFLLLAFCVKITAKKCKESWMIFLAFVAHDMAISPYRAIRYLWNFCIEKQFPSKNMILPKKSYWIN